MKILRFPQPVIRQPQFDYREQPLPRIADSFGFEFTAGKDFAIVADGDSYALWNLDKKELVLFSRTPCLHFFEGDGSRYFGISISFLFDCVCDREEVGRLMGALGDRQDFKERMTYLGQHLHRVLERKSRHALLVSSMYKMRETGGLLATAALAEEKGYTVRQLERIYKKEYGCSPKKMSRMIRFSNALNLMEQDADSSFLKIAKAMNYSDPSHFLREFKDFTGMTPKMFAVKYYGRNGD